MWENLQDRVTDAVFRMEDAGEEAFQEALWAGQRAQHEEAKSYVQTWPSNPRPRPTSNPKRRKNQSRNLHRKDRAQ